VYRDLYGDTAGAFRVFVSRARKPTEHTHRQRQLRRFSRRPARRHFPAASYARIRVYVNARGRARTVTVNNIMQRMRAGPPNPWPDLPRRRSPPPWPFARICRRRRHASLSSAACTRCRMDRVAGRGNTGETSWTTITVKN